MCATSNQAFLKLVFGAAWPRAHTVSVPGDPRKAPGGAWQSHAAGVVVLPPDNNNYYCVSVFREGQRRVAAFDALHVLMVDDVGVKVDPLAARALLGAPSYRLETSRGNEQWGYVLETPCADAARAAGLQARVVAALCDGVDPGMLDLTRLARLPVGMNWKEACQPYGFKTRLRGIWGWSAPKPELAR